MSSIAARRSQKLKLKRAARGAAIFLGLGALDACGLAAPIDSGPCPEGQTSCGQCVDVTQDLLHCGTCNHVCGQGEDCVNGSCTCVGGGLECNGTCVDAKSNANNCGSCGTVCGAGLVCSNGACAATCATGLTTCGRSCVNVQTDAANCGHCEELCETGQGCSAALCSCTQGRTDCGTGCTNLTADLLNCGTCGRTCNTDETCFNSQCVHASWGVGGTGSGGSAAAGGSAAGGIQSAGGALGTSGGAVGESGGTATSGGETGAGGGADPGCSGKMGFYVKNQKLYDKNCAEFILRGVNYPYAWYSTRDLNADFKAIQSVGANVVRIVLATGARWTKTNGSTLTSIINAAKAAKLIAVVEVHDTTGFAEQADSVALTNATAYWTASDIVSALKGQEAYTIINIGNEPNGNDTTATWPSSHETSVKALRAAGLHHTLMVDAANWGQDWENTTRDGAGVSIWNADPDKNLVFSVHMYDVFGTSSTVSTYMNTFLSKYEAPLVVGEFAADHGASKNVDEGAIMMFAESLGLGYMGWSWAGNGDGLGSLDITTNFNVAQLTAWGEALVNGPNGLKATSEVCSVFN